MLVVLHAKMRINRHMQSLQLIPIDRLDLRVESTIMPLLPRDLEILFWYRESRQCCKLMLHQHSKVLIMSNDD